MAKVPRQKPGTGCMVALLIAGAMLVGLRLLPDLHRVPVEAHRGQQ